MKQKILDGLKQKYANLGLSNEAFEGVASSFETFVTDETLASFIEKAEPMLKQYQSIADTARSKKTTELEAKIKELEEKAKQKPSPDDKPGAMTPEEMAKAIKDAVVEATKGLSDEVAALKGAATAKEAAANAKTLFFSGDYAKKYTEQANEAWERAVEINEATGSKMTSDELKQKAEGYFNKSVSKIGVDTSKPFTADPPVDEQGTVDWSSERKRKQEQGKIAADTK